MRRDPTSIAANPPNTIGRAENRRRPAARCRSCHRRRWSVAPPLGNRRCVNDPTREHVIAQFLQANGFALRDARPLAQDASFRRYLRLPGAVLMDAPPPEDVRPFLHIAAHLAALGLSVPRILAADERRPGAEEDFGDALFSTILTEANANLLFDAAIDALVVLHRATAGLPEWGKPAMRDTACGTLFDWWWPATHGRPSAARSSRRDHRPRLEPRRRGRDRSALPRTPRLLRRTALAAAAQRPRRAGSISISSPRQSGIPRTTSSLLQDARRDISPAWEERAVARYLMARPEFHPETFRAAYAVRAAQRHLRVARQWGCGWRNATGGRNTLNMARAPGKS